MAQFLPVEIFMIINKITLKIIHDMRLNFVAVVFNIKSCDQIFLWEKMLMTVFYKGLHSFNYGC